MKTCTKCGIEKELTEFTRDKQKKDGLRPSCKSCENVGEKLTVIRNDGMKACTKCGLEKQITEFSKDKQKKCGLRPSCKMCEKLGRKDYFVSYRNKNKEIIKKNRDKTKDKAREYQLSYYEKNKKILKEKQKIYEKRNKKNLSESRKKYWLNRRAVDPSVNIKLNLRQGFSSRMKMYSKYGKTESFFEHTGLHYSEYIEHFETTQPEEFNLYLEKGAYHIDHIIPCALYDFTDEEEIKKCWHPHNLRIIPAEENLSKSNKLDLQLVDKYNIRHLLPKGGFNEN